MTVRQCYLVSEELALVLVGEPERAVVVRFLGDLANNVAGAPRPPTKTSASSSETR